MKKPEVRRLTVALQDDNGQSVRRAAANAHTSRRTLTRFPSYVEETGDVDFDQEKWNKHEDARTRFPDLRAAVLFAVEQYPEEYLNEISDFIGRVQALLGTDFSISPSSVSRILAANGITRKVAETCFISRYSSAGRSGFTLSGTSPCARGLTWTRSTAAVGPPNASGPGSYGDSVPSATKQTERE